MRKYKSSFLSYLSRLLCGFLFLSSINVAHADCGTEGLSFFPSQKEISLHPMIIVQAYCFDQYIVRNFEYRRVYLEDENGNLIELKLQEILEGDFMISQAIFKPKFKLEKNMNYSIKLAFESKEEQNKLMRYNYSSEQYERVTWSTGNNEYAHPLGSDFKMTFERTYFDEYGCGPGAYANFILERVNQQEIYYKAVLKNIEMNEIKEFVVMSRGESLEIGHGMCSGAFDFGKKAGIYEVQITAMNIDGESNYQTEWIEFKSPYKNLEYKTIED